MKYLVTTTASLMALMGLSAQATELTAVFSAQVEEDEIDAFDGDVDQAFINVQGDDDAFTVYSFADFDPDAPSSAFVELNNVSLTLTQSNAFFSANGGMEFFVASDTRTVGLSDTARYQTDGDNTGSEVVGNAFGTLYSLGTGTYTETSTGDADVFNFTLSNDAENFLLGQINSGGLIRIIATPSDLGVQATYSGATSLLDPAGPPVFSYTGIVPEPGSLALLSLGGLLIARRRRKE